MSAVSPLAGLSSRTTTARAGERPVLERRCLSLDVGASDDVLARVLTLLRRRRCRVVGVDFRQESRHGPGRFELTVLAPPRVANNVRHWLMGLVDVLAVDEADLARR